MKYRLVLSAIRIKKNAAEISDDLKVCVHVYWNSLDVKIYTLLFIPVCNASLETLRENLEEKISQLAVRFCKN